MNYKKLINRIHNLSDGDLIMTDSYNFIDAFSSKQNLIYVNNFKEFTDTVRPDWMVTELFDENILNIDNVEKGICLLTNEIEWLFDSHNLKQLYEVLGYYTHSIILTDNKEFKYFLILRKRCCSKCKFRDTTCCNKDEEHDNQLIRFDFLNYI